MSQERTRDDRTRVVSVRLTEDEIADLPPADTDSGRVRSALALARQFGPTVEAVPAILENVRTLKDDTAGLSARLDARCAALEARIKMIAHSDEAFGGMAVEADARDIETSVIDVWMVCLATWRQTLNNHLNITLIREALVDGDTDPDTLLKARIARLEQLESAEFRDYLDRGVWMTRVTDDWRKMRLRQRETQDDADDADQDEPAPAAAE
jgi:hypothetical protein